MSKDNTKSAEPRFFSGECELPGGHGAAVFDRPDMGPLVYVHGDDVVGGDPLPVAAALARLMNGAGWDGVALLAEAAATFRRYEAHHRSRAAVFEEKMRQAATRTRADGWRGDLDSASAKAANNGALADRIEAWLAGEDVMSAHPVEALRAIATDMAARAGLEVDHEAFDRAKAYVDAPAYPHEWAAETKEDHLARVIAQLDGWVLPAVKVHIRAATGDALAKRYLQRARDALRPFPAAADMHALDNARYPEDAPRFGPGYAPDAGGRPVHVGFTREPMLEGLECEHPKPDAQ